MAELDAQNPTPKFLTSLDAIVQCACALAQGRRWEPAAEVLRAGRVRLGEYEYDNWNGGTYYWTLIVEVPVEIYGKVTAGLKAGEVAKLVGEAITEVMQDRFGNHHIHPVTVVPRLEIVSSKTPRPVGINNQGRAHSDNPAGIQVDGLRFRTKGEVMLYKALRRANVLFAPLPVFIREGAPRKRVEPDFIIIKDGTTLLVEIDGGSHTERPVEAQERVSAFETEGVFVYRVNDSDCQTEAQATKVAAAIVQRIAQLKFAHR